jgi:hypothetical protein
VSAVCRTAGSIVGCLQDCNECYCWAVSAMSAVHRAMMIGQCCVQPMRELVWARINVACSMMLWVGREGCMTSPAEHA